MSVRVSVRLCVCLCVQRPAAVAEWSAGRGHLAVAVGARALASRHVWEECAAYFPVGNAQNTFLLSLSLSLSLFLCARLCVSSWLVKSAPFIETGRLHDKTERSSTAETRRSFSWIRSSCGAVQGEFCNIDDGKRSEKGKKKTRGETEQVDRKKSDNRKLGTKKSKTNTIKIEADE